MKFRNWIIVLAVGLFGAESAQKQTLANEKQVVVDSVEPKFQPIDAETIAAYMELGAEYGRFRANEFGGSGFSVGQDAAAKGLPGFRLGVSEGKLPKLPPVKVPFGLDLALTEVRDAGLKELKNLDNLTLLHLRGTIVNEARPEELKKDLETLKKLKAFSLLRSGGDELSEAELKQLEAVVKTMQDRRSTNSNLAYHLYGTRVTDAGLEKLKYLNSLTELDLTGTAVTDEGVKVLQKALPKCKILR